MYICISIHPSIDLSFCISLSIHPPIHLSRWVNPNPIHPSTHLPI